MSSRASPYSALLSVRRADEQEAEVTLALAHRAVAALEATLGRARAHRDAWIGAPLDGGSLRAIGRIEGVERQADRELIGARARAESARVALLERRRARDAVERLHVAHLAELARQAERRAQAELDDLATLRHGKSF